ncbi:MAG: DUF167 domain-containing protein [Acidobacteriaceae bacterium]|nr:DUF167 domain-containing protein [Acidobacteriaceae bacterium]
MTRGTDPDGGLENLRAALLRERSLVFKVKVIPRASTSAIIGFMDDGTIRAKVAAVPEKGRANEELRQLLARCFGVPAVKVEILAGESSQHKRIRVSL